MLWVNMIIMCEVNGEGLSCHSNKTESVGLRKCPHDNCRTYLSDITETVFRVMPTTWQRIPNGIDVERNDVTVTL